MKASFKYIEVVTAIPAVLTPMTRSFDPVPLRILWAVTSVYYNSVKKSTAISGIVKLSEYFL